MLLIRKHRRSYCGHWYVLILLLTLFIVPIASGETLDNTSVTDSHDSLKPVLPGDYDPNNLLARTARGEIPSAKLYEDEHVLAFLGDRPSAHGHFLVISKTSKARNFLEIEPEELARILSVARRVAEAEIVAIGAEGFTLRQNNGSASSLHQFHLHVLPRWKGDQLKSGPQPEVKVSELEPLAERIRAVLDK